MLEELNVLRERKRLLRAEADLHRTLLRAEVARAKRPSSWFPGGGRLPHIAAWLARAELLTPFLKSEGLRKLIRWAPLALPVWHLFRGKARVPKKS